MNFLILIPYMVIGLIVVITCIRITKNFIKKPCIFIKKNCGSKWRLTLL